MAARLRQSVEYSREDAHPGPAGKPIVQGLAGTVDQGRIVPSRPYGLTLIIPLSILQSSDRARPCTLGKNG